MTHMVDWLTAQDERGGRSRSGSSRTNRHGIPRTNADPGENPFAPPPPPPAPIPVSQHRERGPSGGRRSRGARAEAIVRRCTDKKRYDTMVEAEEAAQRHLDAYGEVKDPYECDRCRGFHIGTSDGRKRRK